MFVHQAKLETDLEFFGLFFVFFFFLFIRTLDDVTGDGSRESKLNYFPFLRHIPPISHRFVGFFIFQSV